MKERGLEREPERGWGFGMTGFLDVVLREQATESQRSGKKELTFKKRAGLKRASQKWAAAGTG